MVFTGEFRKKEFLLLVILPVVHSKFGYFKTPYFLTQLGFNPNPSLHKGELEGISDIYKELRFF